MTVATCTAGPLLWPLVVTTANKAAPSVSPVMPVTVKEVAVEAVTVPVPVGVKATVLLPGVVASKPVPVIVSVVPVMVSAVALLSRSAVFSVTVRAGVVSPVKASTCSIRPELPL